MGKLDSKKFTRKIEDFICDNCSAKNIGNGYTNHCHNCLWSKHVDKNPGDRAEKCAGLMKPISSDKKGESLLIKHKCSRCGFERNASFKQGDNFDAFLKI